jgi:hypothetical protein
LGFLAWRYITVRSKQTSIGVLWAFIRPFLTMVIFSVVFGRIVKLPSNHVPYAVLTFSALLPWQFFSTAFADAANAVVGNGYMITKIYFPRLILLWRRSRVVSSIPCVVRHALHIGYGTARSVRAPRNADESVHASAGSGSLVECERIRAERCLLGPGAYR